MMSNSFQTYKDLLLETDILTTRLLSDEHLNALRLFRRRTLVANVRKDPFVNFGSASLCYGPSTEGVSNLSCDNEEAHVAALLQHHYGTLPQPVDNVRYPSVWNPFRVRPSDTLGTPAVHEQSSFIQRSRSIAFTLKAAMPWLVVPVCASSWSPSAHKAILGCSRFGKSLDDAIEFIAFAVISDSCAAVSDA